MGWRGYECEDQRQLNYQLQRHWIPDQVGNDRKREVRAGFRPRTPRSFCFGKRTQNHWRPGVALRVPLPQSRR